MTELDAGAVPVEGRAMIALWLRVLVLVARSRAAWPEQPLERVVPACAAAARAEARTGVDAETMLAIAEHESDLRPNTVSWRDDAGRRVDKAVDNLCTGVPVDRPATSGLVQTVTRGRAACRAMLRPGAAMLAGARELAEWRASPTCRGDLKCGLAGYAGGNAGALAARAGRRTLAVQFADLFIARSRHLRVAALPES